MATRTETAQENGENKGKRMKTSAVGLYCAVGGCSSKQSDGYTLHTFPKDAKLRQAWTKFVTVCRANFGPAFGTPNKYSAICQLHFTEDCYPAHISLMSSFGMKSRRFLKSGSIPTIQKPVVSVTTPHTSPLTPASKARGATFSRDTSVRKYSRDRWSSERGKLRRTWLLENVQI